MAKYCDQANYAAVQPNKKYNNLSSRKRRGGRRGVRSEPHTVRMPTGTVLHVEQEGAEPEIVILEIASIEANPFQPRTNFSEEELRELAKSIADVGVLQPVMVRPAGIGAWQLVAGERRLRASVLAGRSTIPAIVRNLDDYEMRRIAIIENVQRADLNVMEEAAAYAALIEQAGCTQAEVGELLGKSRAHISHVLGMRRLPDSVQMKVASGTLTFGHGKALQGIADYDPEAAELLATRAVAQGMTVRNLEEAVLLASQHSGKSKARRSRKSRSNRNTPTNDLPQISSGLESWLDTRVTVTSATQPGRILIEFADLADLDRILETMKVPRGLLMEGE